MLPVDKYVGGAEHACMHLLYSRFITKALRDMGYIHFDEPFRSLVHQGVILGPDGTRMSKSKGNIINPDKYVSEYGSDTFRLYLMFGFSYMEGGPWSDDGIKSVAKFLDRVERMVTKEHSDGTDEKAGKELEYALNYCIKNVTADTEAFSFNTAIARIMELVNVMYKVDGLASRELMEKASDALVLILAPFVPHVSEELYHVRGGKEQSVFLCRYPVCDESKLVKDELELAVQFNSRVKTKIFVPSTADNAEIEKIALSDPKVVELLAGTPVKKVIVIKNRLVNLVI